MSLVGTNVVKFNLLVFVTYTIMYSKVKASVSEMTLNTPVTNNWL